MRETTVPQSAFSIALVLLLAACGSGTRPNPSQLRDTTGLKFGWACNDQGCQTTADVPPPFQTCDQSTGYTVLLDRLFYICSSTSLPGDDTISGWSPADCRATACSSDADCPIFEGYTYTCSGDVCVDLGIGVPQDSEQYLIALCLASTPRPADCEASDPAADALVAQSCDATDLTCTVPSTCTQP